MTKLGYLIAKEEGFFRSGTLPNRNHNPGDLRHSPHSFHDPGAPDGIGRIDTDEHGWEDLDRQLKIDAGRGMTLQQAIYSWAPPSENNTAQYLADVLAGFGGAVGPDTPLADVHQIQQGCVSGGGVMVSGRGAAFGCTENAWTRPRIG